MPRHGLAGTSACRPRSFRGSHVGLHPRHASTAVVAGPWRGQLWRQHLAVIAGSPGLRQLGCVETLVPGSLWAGTRSNGAVGLFLDQSRRRVIWRDIHGQVRLIATPIGDHLSSCEHLRPVVFPVGVAVVAHRHCEHLEVGVHKVVAMGIGELPLLQHALRRPAAGGDVLTVRVDVLSARPLPGAAAVQGGVREVVLVGHVLRVALGCAPEPTLKLHVLIDRRVVPAQGTRVALPPQLVGKVEVCPLHWQDLICADGRWRRRGRRRRRGWRGVCTVAPVLALAVRIPDKAPVAAWVAVWVAAVVLAWAVWHAR
mmetsp:Transcript_72504/g.234599  ORF Transcript_72504/g.234599 Transcript_72504/m.234599 type:complete len:313 (-) Transcript_72504:292-1230(-)